MTENGSEFPVQEHQNGHRTILFSDLHITKDHEYQSGDDRLPAKQHVYGETIPHTGREYSTIRGIELEKEIRRLQRLGTASLGVSIPKEWAKARGFKVGSLLNMTLSDEGNIVISPSDAGTLEFPTDCIIHADSCPDEKLILRTIIGCYIAGYDTIRVTSAGALTGNQNEKVRLAVDMLTGVTVVEQSSTHVLLEVMVQPPNFPSQTYPS